MPGAAKLVQAGSMEPTTTNDQAAKDQRETYLVVWFTVIVGLLAAAFCWLAGALATAQLFAGPPREPTARELYVQKIWWWEIAGSLCVAAWLICVFLERSASVRFITFVAALAFAGGPIAHYMLLS